MAAGQFRTELATMQQAVAHVLQVNSKIQSELSSLMGKLEPVFGDWKGEGASTFRQAKTAWNADALRLSGSLQSIAGTLAANQANYASSESTNTSGFTQIAGVL